MFSLIRLLYTVLSRVYFYPRFRSSFPPAPPMPRRLERITAVTVFHSIGRIRETSAREAFAWDTSSESKTPE